MPGRLKINNSRLPTLFAALALALSLPLPAAELPQPDSQRYLTAVRAFADTVLEHGRDTYGERHTPLFVDGLQAESFEPVRWKKGGQTWVLCNFASQQALLRTLDGLSALTKEDRYRRAAEEATRYALSHLRSTNGLLYWGGHIAWDLDKDRPVGEYADIHELKNHQAYYPLFWRVDARATRELLGAIWAAHVLDWSLLDYNRHAKTEQPLPLPWDHQFAEKTPVPFASVGNNLSFVNVTLPLLDSGAALSVHDKNTNALVWTRRLLWRWQQGRDPKTGLCGGQLSYRKQDRAQEALGHVHPDINEAKIVASYHRVGRYHHLPLAQMQAGEELIAAGGPWAKAGHEFIHWAAEDLKTYFRLCYNPKTAEFNSLLTDGTPIQWQQSHAGYYDASSFAPARPDADILWGCALGCRLTHEKCLWSMARELGEPLGLGDMGQPGGAGRSLELKTSATDWRLIYALLELAKISKDPLFLKLASRIADNVLCQQSKSGLFPRPGRAYARTGDEVPLALLHLAAALEGRESSLPPAILDNAYFHCQYDGATVRKNPNIDDPRTYDTAVFYGSK